MYQKPVSEKSMRLCILAATLFAFSQAHAHVVVNELSEMSKSSVALVYLKLGFLHILPLGLDHILFIIALSLLNPKLKTILIQASIFTLAHSITLGLAIFKILMVPPFIVEPLISASILFVALGNIFFPKLNSSRLAVVFLFGLIHGMGFAGALGGLGLPKESYLLGLIMFNIGVELGQCAIIIISYMLFVKWLKRRMDYRKYVVFPISIVIAAISAYWTIERLFL
jgi:hypothetical protein